MGTDALAPEHLVSLVEQDDADIGPEAFSVKHNQPQIFKLSSLCIAPCELRSDHTPVVSLSAAGRTKIGSPEPVCPAHLFGALPF
ncbi:hypothetical protein D9M69_673020 [compost metagenome]